MQSDCGSVHFGGVLNIQPVDEANTEYTTVHININGVSKDVRVPVPFLKDNNNTTKIRSAEDSGKEPSSSTLVPSDLSDLERTETEIIGNLFSELEEQVGNHVLSTSSVSERTCKPQISKRHVSSIDDASADQHVHLNNVIVIAPDGEQDQSELCASIQKQIQTTPVGGCETENDTSSSVSLCTDSTHTGAPRRHLVVSRKRRSTIGTALDSRSSSSKTRPSPMVVQHHNKQESPFFTEVSFAIKSTKPSSKSATYQSGDGKDKKTSKDSVTTPAYVMVTSSKPESQLLFVFGTSNSTVTSQVLPITTVTDAVRSPHTASIVTSAASGHQKRDDGQQSGLCITSVCSLKPAATTDPVNDENASDSNHLSGFSAPSKGVLHRIFTDIQNPISETDKKQQGSNPDGAVVGGVGQKATAVKIAPSSGKKRGRTKRKSDGEDKGQLDKRIKQECFRGFKENPLLRVHVQKLDLGPRFRSCKIDRLQQHLAYRRRAKKCERNKTALALDKNSNRLVEEENKKPSGTASHLPDEASRGSERGNKTGKSSKLIMIKTSAGRYLLPVVPGLTIDGLMKSLKSGALKLPPVKTEKEKSAAVGGPSWKPTCQRSLLKKEGLGAHCQQTPALPSILSVRPVAVVSTPTPSKLPTTEGYSTLLAKSTSSYTLSKNTSKRKLKTDTADELAEKTCKDERSQRTDIKSEITEVSVSTDYSQLQDDLGQYGQAISLTSTERIRLLKEKLRQQQAAVERARLQRLKTRQLLKEID